MLSYKKLDAWIYSMDIVKEIYQITKKYPKEEMFGLTSQTKRAAVSIPCNIAEGLGRNFKKDSIQFLHISRGSAYEIETLLSVAVMVQIIDQETYNRLNQMLEKSIRLINGLIHYLEEEKNLK
ncbi:MAG: four helix bundle protein [Chitinophagales bacterium]